MAGNKKLFLLLFYIFLSLMIYAGIFNENKNISGGYIFQNITYMKLKEALNIFGKTILVDDKNLLLMKSNSDKIYLFPNSYLYMINNNSESFETDDLIFRNNEYYITPQLFSDIFSIKLKKDNNNYYFNYVEKDDEKESLSWEIKTVSLYFNDDKITDAKYIEKDKKIYFDIKKLITSAKMSILNFDSTLISFTDEEDKMYIFPKTGLYLPKTKLTSLAKTEDFFMKDGIFYIVPEIFSKMAGIKLNIINNVYIFSNNDNYFFSREIKQPALTEVTGIKIKENGSINVSIAMDKDNNNVSITHTNGKNSYVIKIKNAVIKNEILKNTKYLSVKSYSFIKNEVLIDIITDKEYKFTSSVQNNTINIEFSTEDYITVTLDAGHGGIDPGALSVKGLREKDLTLKAVTKISEYLKSKNIKVILTRDVDKHISPDKITDLTARVNIANNNSSDLFVSIHFNSSSDTSVKDFEIYYAGLPDNRNAFIDKVSQRFNLDKKNDIDALNTWTDKKYLSMKETMRFTTIMKEQLTADSLKLRKILPADFYVINYTTMPALLLELDYLSNPDAEAKLLANDDYINKLSKSIADCIINFFNTK